VVGWQILAYYTLEAEDIMHLLLLVFAIIGILTAWYYAVKWLHPLYSPFKKWLFDTTIRNKHRHGHEFEYVSRHALGHYFLWMHDYNTFYYKFKCRHCEKKHKVDISYQQFMEDDFFPDTNKKDFVADKLVFKRRPVDFDYTTYAKTEDTKRSKLYKIDRFIHVKRINKWLKNKTYDSKQRKMVTKYETSSDQAT
jgi:hypothetical protein